MRTVKGTAVLAAFLAIPGCLSAQELGDSVGSWSAAEGDLWAISSHGCGFCSGSPDYPEFSLAALYTDGRVAVFDYALARSSNGTPMPLLRIGLEPYTAAFREVMDRARVYAEGEGNGSLNLLGVATAQLEPAAWARLRSGLEDAMRDPGDTEASGEITFTDCGPGLVEVFAQGVTNGQARMGCGVEAGPGWTHVQQELAKLEEWTRQEGDAAVQVDDQGTLVPLLATAYRETGDAGIAAAYVVRTCGGMAYGCSGSTGLVLHEDGDVIAFWGTPWAPQAEGRTACDGTSLRGLAQTLGPGWELPCTPDGEWAGIYTPRSGTIPIGAWPSIQTHVQDRPVGDLPAAEHACCDRIHTELRVFSGGSQARYVVEGTAIPDGDEVPAALGPYAQLRALQLWLAPSRPGWAEACNPC